MPTTRKKWAIELSCRTRRQRSALQTSVDQGEAKADRFDLPGEVLLEIGLVIVSITLLILHSRIYWHLGLGVCVLGVLAAASAFFLESRDGVLKIGSVRAGLRSTDGEPETPAKLAFLDAWYSRNQRGIHADAHTV